MSDEPNRAARRAARADGELDTAAFLETAGKFIELANRQNRKIKATDLHMAFLFGAARYNAHTAKAVIGIEDHEKFVEQMVKSYAEMLRQHLADPSLDPTS